MTDAARTGARGEREPACSALVVIGPSGSGKSTLGRALATDLDRAFIEGDDLHPPANVLKMSAGMPLDASDRRPFLDNVGQAIADAQEPVVASCSALRREHRERLRTYARDILFIWVDVDRDELERRMRRRPGHFMPASLLADQLASFEPPDSAEPCLRIDGKLPTSEQVSRVKRYLATLR